ncbi:MAG: hypothetical protein LUD29_04580 [Clostridia bacterium]|nr:hypothetical protein [Clostridia bacterium]
MNQITEKGYDDYFEYRGYHGDVIHVGLNFKKMTEKKKAALAKKGEGHADDGGKRFFGNDAGLGTHWVPEPCAGRLLTLKILRWKISNIAGAEKDELT